MWCWVSLWYYLPRWKNLCLLWSTAANIFVMWICGHGTVTCIQHFFSSHLVALRLWAFNSLSPTIFCTDFTHPKYCHAHRNFSPTFQKVGNSKYVAFLHLEVSMLWGRFQPWEAQIIILLPNFTVGTTGQLKFSRYLPNLDSSIRLPAQSVNHSAFAFWV